jgi:hypothetical protein
LTPKLQEKTNQDFQKKIFCKNITLIFQSGKNRDPPTVRNMKIWNFEWRSDLVLIILLVNSMYGKTQRLLLMQEACNIFELYNDRKFKINHLYTRLAQK